jgi:hypothetical protein
MLPLSGKTFPTTAAALADALAQGLAKRGLTARSVQAAGGEFPAIDRLEIDLTNARLTRGFRAASAEGDHGSVAVRQLTICGVPIFFETAPVELRIAADQAAMRFAGSPADGTLELTDAASGTVSLSISRPALEALIQTIVAEAAAKQGVEVKTTKLELISRGPRALSFRADVTAKVFVMSATLNLSGNLDVDGDLNARISKLALGGDAMITKLAGGFIRPYLEKIEGRIFPLLAFAPGKLKLRDVEISVGESLEVRAKFA